jgi:hypothetical protein
MINMSDIQNDWMNLSVGDRIQFKKWPVELKRSNLHAETIELYDWLIESGFVISIFEISDDGYPVARIERVINGEWRSEYLMINHSGFNLI